MENLYLHPCGPNDLEALRAISIETFIRAFATQNNPEDFKNYLEKAFGREQLRSELAHPEMHFYFAYLKANPDAEAAVQRENLPITPGNFPIPPENLQVPPDERPPAPAAYFKLNTGRAQNELREDEGMEIERIYVVPEYQGKGIGKHLLNAVCGLASAMHKSYIWLGVWEQNPRAIAFYKRAGFHTFGKHPYYIGSDRQMDWLMRLDLNDNKTLNS